MLVVADGRMRLPYHTYVLQGLAELGHTVRFRRLDAPDGDGLALRIGSANVWVDTDDTEAFDEAAYEWADVFGKVNCTEAGLVDRNKVCLLGPLFGIRLWELPAGYLQLPVLVAAGRPPRAALADLRFQGVTRLPIGNYVPGDSEADFVFHASRAWAGKHDGTNRAREIFRDAVDVTAVRSEISFTHERMPLSDYLDQTRRSSLVFNAPSVHACLGWKLGEYLALGKAIMSTELGRALPAPLEHGVHVHYVRSEIDDMAAAIEEINGRSDYRRTLELGARRWYEQHMAPSVAAGRLIEWTA
jgi:hypothetical protein